MTRRISLPGAAELFRPTEPERDTPGWFEDTAPAERTEPVEQAPRRGTPRQKHNSKITVYVSDAELFTLEHARLVLRGLHGLAVDRGRVVREAVAVILADLEENGEDSVLVRRLRQDSGP